MESLDDAGVYRLSADLALIQTVDFFTPIVDDPYTFGQVAVANALSDIYSMGGRPLTALNILCFPVGTMDASVLEDILRGGLDKLDEADTALVGGHSVEDTELKYGLAVTGTVHPDRLVSSAGARPGDRLVLTKPLGTGIINTAAKGGQADEALVERIARSMATLNRTAAELMLEAGAHACTDITGFGLLGHAAQMAEQSQVGLTFKLAAVPLFPEVVTLARRGLCPGGLFRNKKYYAGRVSFRPGIEEHLQDVLFDAQTSGGLLVSLDAGQAEAFLARLHQAGIREAAIVGEVTSGEAGKIRVE